MIAPRVLIVGESPDVARFFAIIDRGIERVCTLVADAGRAIASMRLPGVAAIDAEEIIRDIRDIRETFDDVPSGCFPASAHCTERSTVDRRPLGRERRRRMHWFAGRPLR